MLTRVAESVLFTCLKVRKGVDLPKGVCAPACAE
jgi:hypothetical protein